MLDSQKQNLERFRAGPPNVQVELVILLERDSNLHMHFKELIGDVSLREAMSEEALEALIKLEKEHYE